MIGVESVQLRTTGGSKTSKRARGEIPFRCRQWTIVLNDVPRTIGRARIAQDVDVLCGHVALGEQYRPPTFAVFGDVDDEHGVSRRAALNEDIARFDVSDIDDLELARERKSACVAEHDVQVVAERNVAVVGLSALGPGSLSTTEVRAHAALPFFPPRRRRVRKAKANVAVTAGLMLELGAQSHDRVGALLPVAIPHIHVEHEMMRLLIPFLLSVEQSNLRTTRLDRQTTKPSSETVGGNLDALPPGWRGNAALDCSRRWRRQPRVGRSARCAGQNKEDG